MKIMKSVNLYQKLYTRGINIVNTLKEVLDKKPIECVIDINGKHDVLKLKN